MNFLIVQSIVSIVAGIMIFIKPELLNFIVAFYLVLAGALGLFLALT
tara:strand:- start:128 stop:268 length:141 start_codon:yes stop_codon:yes gene_type:complete